MPSANIPGSPTSRRATGRAGRPARWRRAAARAGAARARSASGQSDEIASRRRHRSRPACRASASRSSATATRAARRRSTSSDSGIDVVVGLRDGSPSVAAYGRRWHRHRAHRRRRARRRPRHAARPRRDARGALSHDRTRSTPKAPRSASATAWRSASDLIRPAPRPRRHSWSLPRDPAPRFARSTATARAWSALFAVAQDASGSAEALALAYGRAIGCGRAGLIVDQLCRGMRGRSVQRGRRRVGRGPRDPRRRLRHVWSRPGSARKSPTWSASAS